MSDDSPRHVLKWKTKRIVVMLSFMLVTGVFIVYGVSSSTTSDHPFPVVDNIDNYFTTNLQQTAEHEKEYKGSKPNRTARLKTNNIRILCLILTMEKDLQTKVRAVNSTWVPRCDRYFYVISSKIHHKDFLNIDIKDSRKNLINKMKAVYRTIYKKYLNEFDYILKADDDTYVIIENLRYLLSHYDKNAPGYLGFHFNHFIPNGYMSGGAGYVISNSALRHMVEYGYNKNLCDVIPNHDDPENSEDLETGKCLHAAGVPILSSLDLTGRETFHPYPPQKHLLGGLPGYIYGWAKNPIRTGRACCSRYTISYHYLDPGTIYLLDHLLYYTSVHGLQDRIPKDEQLFEVRRLT